MCLLEVAFVRGGEEEKKNAWAKIAISLGKYAMKAVGNFVSKYILGQKTLPCDNKLTGTG
jgi:hypothetical protein